MREEERTHIAREIHDELGQVLTALKMDIAWLAKHLDDAALLEKTDAMRQLVDVRGFVDRLRYIHTHFDSTSQFLDRDVIVRVDADLACDLHRFLHDLSSVQVRIFFERPGGGERESTAGTDADDPIIRLNQVAGPRDQKCALVVGNDHDRFEVAQRPVGPPILGKLDSSAAQVSMELFEFGFKAREQGE